VSIVIAAKKVTKTLKDESGQSIFLVAVVILSFLMFFDFAINTGLLITAKISVQNAADAAAYAGAATQARQLNAISYLNYDMRRQYKKFLFRYAFVGSLGSPEFPGNVHLDGMTYQTLNPDQTYTFPKKDFSINPAKPTVNSINVPVVCIPLNTSGQHNDNCLTINLPNTQLQVQKLFPNGGVTAITQSLLKDLQAIQSTQTTICQGQGEINLFVLMSWLFRGDITQSALTNTMNAMLSGVTVQDRTTAINTVSSLVEGLGLFPRNILNLMRIETLEGFLNQQAEPEVTLDKVHSWEGATETADSHERTIQAFRSALANLNASVMNPADLTMTELESNQQFQHDPIQVDFDAYLQLNKVNPNGTGQTICNSAILPFTARNAPVGIRRHPSPSTYYAVKVKTKAKLLFLPIKDGLELEAVAGAQPFGSRIGPAEIEGSDFIEKRTTGSVNGVPICDPSLGGGDPCASPNLKVGGTNSFYTREFLDQLHQLAVVGNTLNDTTVKNAQAAALSPNPAEVGLYNILPPAPKDPASMNKEFIPYAMTPGSTVYRFYAPLFPGGANNTKERVAQFIEKMFKKTNVGKNALGLDDQTVKQSLEDTINQYITKLDTGTNTEHSESSTFAAIELPMSPGSNTPVQPSTQGFWLTQSNEVLSSWSRSGTPRFGYSVKFVTMQNLLSQGMPDLTGDLGKVSH